METLFNFGTLAFLLALGYFAGSAAERKHYRTIRKREASFLRLPAVTIRSTAGLEDVERSKLVSGSAVISVDYFKRMLAGIRAIVGGRIKSYESLLDRARREAILRMKAQAPGADTILNMRIETTTISRGRADGKQSVSTVEALAYGTAVYLRK